MYHLKSREYYDSRKPFHPEHGVVYENEGGGMYECTSWKNDDTDTALFRNVKSGWHFVAHGIGIYADGKIDWDYSTSGTFSPLTERDILEYNSRKEG